MKKILLRAFSLIELMITLIVVSCITAALAPMITKRLTSKDIIVGSATSSTTTTTEICPAGYYCPEDGTKTMCPSGTFNNTSNATDSSACVACSTLIENCSTCDIVTGGCIACNSGYELNAGICKRKEFKYEYTGSATKTTLDTYTRIVLTTSGTFSAKSDADGKIMVLGGGGGGGGATSSGNGGVCGCAGYNTQSEFSFISDTSWTVTIGAGGSGAPGDCFWDYHAGGTGGTSKFGTITAYGGAGGYGCTGGSAFTFADTAYASGCAAGVNTGTGGKAGSGHWWSDTYGWCGNSGGTGMSGVVVITIPK